MNSIKTDQNLPIFIELLKAQRIAYSQCKQFQAFDIISILIAIFFPLIVLMAPEYQNQVNAFGVLWTAAYLVTELYRKGKTIQGATIQEQFDTELYSLEWNNVLCKNVVNSDTIQGLAAKYKGNDLDNWYSTKLENNLPKQVATLLCQRINFSWEINQRKKFVFFLSGISIIYYMIYILIGFGQNIGFFDLLILLSPSIPFLVFSVQNILSLKSHILSKNETLTFIDSELDNYKNHRTPPSTKTLRQIQDTIFTERTVTEKVPDWFYRLYQSSNESFIDNLILKIQNNF